MSIKFILIYAKQIMNTRNQTCLVCKQMKWKLGDKTILTCMC